MAASCFQLPAWFCISLIWLIRSIVPLAWFYFVSSLLCYLLPDQYYSLLNYPLNGHHHHKQQQHHHHQPQVWSSLCLFLSTIEVAFSIYYLYSAHLVQRRVAQFEHPTSFIRTTINRIVGSGLGPDHTSNCSSNSTNSVSGSPDSADRLENETLLTCPQASSSSRSLHSSRHPLMSNIN
jgi:hypothetical protein